jgi:hypothetical protein
MTGLFTNSRDESVVLGLAIIGFLYLSSAVVKLAKTLYEARPTPPNKLYRSDAIVVPPFLKNSFFQSRKTGKYLPLGIADDSGLKRRCDSRCYLPLFGDYGHCKLLYAMQVTGYGSPGIILLM